MLVSVHIPTVGYFVKPVIGRMSKLINDCKTLFGSAQGII